MTCCHVQDWIASEDDGMSQRWNKMADLKW